jgi:hypothetical protein
MHLFNVASVFSVLLLVGVEFSVSAFVNPGAWRLDLAQSRVTKASITNPQSLTSAARSSRL